MKRIALRLLLALFATLAVVALGIIGWAELQVRAAARHPVVPSSLDVGPASDNAKPVLILLHGAGLNGHMWDPVRRHLDPAYRVIALDLPGHGSRRDETFSLEGAAATVAAAVEAVAPSPVLLVGDSLGGYSAMAAASSLPRSQLRGLVLAGSSSNFEGSQLPGYLKDVVLITLLSAVVDESDFGARALAALGVAEADRPPIVAAGVSLRAVPRSARSLLGVDFRAKLAAIEAPVLIVNGALDARAIAQEESFVAAAPHATQRHFENTGHGVSMRRSADFAALVNAFAARALASTPAPKP